MEPLNQKSRKKLLLDKLIYFYCVYLIYRRRY